MDLNEEIVETLAEEGYQTPKDPTFNEVSGTSDIGGSQTLEVHDATVVDDEDAQENKVRVCEDLNRCVVSEVTTLVVETETTVNTYMEIVEEELQINHGDVSENVNGRSKCSVETLENEGDVENHDDFVENLNIEAPNPEILAKEENNEEKDEEEDDEHEENEYSVGDFVWGKIKHHPWWPGQVYDPINASDLALKHKQKDRYLVAYSGDGTFAWCNSSQLQPFEENFAKLSKQTNSKSFTNAIESVLEEISQLIEWKLTCSCVLKNNRFEISRPFISNGGLKDGVFMPENGNSKMTQFESDRIISELKNISRVGSVTSVLELAVLRSKLTAFYRAKTGNGLPVYHAPQFIIGLEDKSKPGLDNNGDHDMQVDPPNQGPEEDDWLEQSSKQKSPLISDDKLYQRRKQKSIADIINEETDFRSNSRKKKVNLEDNTSSKKRKKLKYDSGSENSDLETETKETEIGNSPRERKKSKYLSPPFTNLENRGKKSKSETGFLTVTNSSRIGEKMSKAANQILSSPSMIKCSTEKPIMDHDDDDDISDFMAKVSANEVLNKLKYAGANHSCLNEPEFLDTIRVFFSAFRNSNFVTDLAAESGSLTDPDSSESNKLRKKRVKKNDEKGSESLSMEAIKEKLVKMTTMVERYDGNFAEEMKSNLEGELKGLLENVSRM